MWLRLNGEDKVPQIIWLAATFLSPFFRKTTFPTALEASRSPPSQIWLNVTSRLGAERGFLAELRREQELSGFVCLSVCSCVYPPPQSLSAWDIKTKQYTPKTHLYGFNGLETASTAMDPSMSSCYPHWATLLRRMLQCPEERRRRRGYPYHFSTARWNNYMI